MFPQSRSKFASFPSLHALTSRASVALALVIGIPSQGNGQDYQLWQFVGPSPGAEFGASVAGAGDVDGDGVPDLIVGSPNAFMAGVTAGQARVFSGSSGSVLRTLDPSSTSSYWGTAVAGPGDLNADGFEDFVVGAPYGTPGGLTLAGQAQVLSGANGAVLFYLDGTTAYSRLGTSVASAGDVDGDGTSDIVAGAPFNFSTGVPGAGEAKVFSGATGAVVLSLVGMALGEEFGHSVAGAGDVDGDAHADLVVGAPYASEGGIPLAGAARVFSGGTGGILFTFEGSTAFGNLGWSVSGGSDMTGDGIPDLAAGAPNANQVKLFSGTNGLTLAVLAGPGNFGSSLADAGDLDGDGRHDLFVGALGADQVWAVSGSSGLLLFMFPGFAGTFGSSVANVGDMNLDGLSDVAVGNPASTLSSPGGLVGVFSTVGIPPGASVFGSGCPGTAGKVPSITTTGGFPSAALGNPAFGIRLTSALGGTGAILILGTSFQSWMGIPLPLSLDPFGSPGCALFVSADVLVPLLTNGSGAGNGSATVHVPVPVDATLGGALLHFQFYVVDPGPAFVPGALPPALQVLVL